MKQEIVYGKGYEDRYKSISISNKVQKALEVFGVNIGVGFGMIVLSFCFLIISINWFFIALAVGVFTVCFWGMTYDHYGGYDAETNKKVRVFDKRIEYYDMLNTNNGEIRRVYIKLTSRKE